MTNIETALAQLGNRRDERTGAVSLPIHLSTAYAHPGLGESTGFDYTRTKNPTRTVLEEGLAELEGGTHAFATSSGMSAIQLVFECFSPGSHFLVTRDIYGGSFRYFEELARRGQHTFAYFNDETDLAAQITGQTAAVFVETPTNPLMQEVDIAEIARITRAAGSILIVDNTLLTPLRQKPLTLGAHISLHSGTKYLTGHNDILAGVVVTNDPTLGEKLAWLANTTGPTLSPFDCWLFIRSLKTLPLRLDKQEANAREIAAALAKDPEVTEVLYPGRGAMMSIRLKDAGKVDAFLRALRVFTFAESLGGVESFITYPTTQTHYDIPVEIRESYGLTADLLRISVGIETAADLVADIWQALRA
ncbi:MAG: PLP-dependent transferase [Microbacteriaceae bacterium]|nr:PLP-dependent transferase [Microbacteriaceae bacterium]